MDLHFRGPHWVGVHCMHFRGPHWVGGGGGGVHCMHFRGVFSLKICWGVLKMPNIVLNYGNRCIRACYDIVIATVFNADHCRSAELCLLNCHHFTA